MLVDRSLPEPRSPRMLVVYGTTYGQTERIVRRLASALTDRGWEVSVQKGDALPPGLAPDRYDACLVAASIIAGRHQRYVKRFVLRHVTSLNNMGSAFVSVSGAAGDPRLERQAEAQKYVSEFLAETGWRPRWQVAVGGAMAYTKYGFLLRWLTQWISRRNGGPTDTSRDHELTDWAAVDRFALLLADSYEHAERWRAAGAQSLG